ncbi:MAG: MFS transporter [Peptoniphilaceae bacterium]|nr:MFS transporter [Peptoniphilaceae bacterium]MDD7434445.1 MFS transporter [Peptoniphilaceae bacterium]MDY3075647.1 MFS transporter [Peptoniphilaceae bacterium]MDY3986507.1 MFS transporter [Peptoniphilaceae bacterium]
MESNHNQSSGSFRAYMIEAILFFTYAFFAVNWIAGSTLTAQIAASFGVDSGASSSFVSNAVTLAKIVGNFMAAYILGKLLPKKSIGLGSALIFVGSLIAVFAQSYLMFIIGRFLMGFGGAVFVIYFAPVVIHYFTPAQRPTVNALNSCAYNFGAVLALLIVGSVIALFQTWQKSMGFFAVISGILFVLWIFFGEDFELNKATAESRESKYSMADVLKEKITWLLPLTYSGVLILYLTLLQLFPRTEGAVISAASLSALSGIGGIIGTLLAIVLSKKYTKRKPVIILSGLIMTGSAFLMVKTSMPALAITAALLLGIFMFLPMTSLVMIPQELPDMTPSRLTAIMGIFWATAYIIETIVFFLFGVLFDKTGSNSSSIMIAVILSLSFAVGGLFLPETGKSEE